MKWPHSGVRSRLSMSPSPLATRWPMRPSPCADPRLPRTASFSMPEPLPESESLIFQWDKPVRSSRGLAFWLFVVLLALAGFFYLFQVVYPQAQRFTPVPHHIVALNAADASGREVLNKVQDQ